MRLGGVRTAVWAQLVLLSCMAPGCAQDTSYRPDILLVVVDTLRADHLPFYGYPVDTAPFLAGWAARSVVFERAWSTSSWTAPATASILTGVYPVQHGVHRGLVALGAEEVGVESVPDELETTAELLRSAGYRTFGVADNPNVSSERGYSAGFEHFENFWYAGAARVNDTIKGWLPEIARADPWFVYLHYMDPHEPYHGRESRHRTGLRKRAYQTYAYDSEISLVDAHLREMFEILGVDDTTLVIFTSDHGEEFWEHGSNSHRVKLYSELTRVPLFMRLPGKDPRRIRANVSSVDLLPTLRSVLGLPVSEQDAGVDLTRLDEHDEAPRSSRPVFASRVHPKRSMRSVVLGDHKLIQNEPGGSELYDLATDPREQTNLADELSDLVQELSETSADFLRSTQKWSSTPIRIEPTEDQLRRLEELGYVESD